MKRTHTRLAGMALLSVVAITGCGSTGDKSAQSDEPVKVTHCGTGQDTTMELRATNNFPDPTAYFIQLYWFDKTGRQADALRMTSPAIQPGKSITFTAEARMPGEGWTCGVKVLGAE